MFGANASSESRIKRSVDDPGMDWVCATYRKIRKRRRNTVVFKNDPKEYEKAAKELRVQLQQSLGFEQLSDYLNGLWKKSEIKINQTVLAQF